MTPIDARLCAVSVDLDEIPCYAAIHGLTNLKEEQKSAIYDKAIGRLTSFFRSENIDATFFAIGRDLSRERNRAIIGELADAGHEIGNHSQNHLYDLTRQPIEVMRAEVTEAQDAIERACGTRPVGFRAPGYTINDSLVSVLTDAGFEYDSSVFPCPAYYGAKTAAIGWIRARGRRSESVVDDPRVLRAPANPYRVGAPYYRRGGGLLEFPIGVTRGLRLPFIGTSVVLSPPLMAKSLAAQMHGRPLINLELHGIDLADAEEDGLGELAKFQPDLRRSARAKTESLRAAVSQIRKKGYRFTTLCEAARIFQASGI